MQSMFYRAALCVALCASLSACYESRPSVASNTSTSSASASNNPTLSERYPSPWRTDGNLDIMKALSGAKARDCGEFKYRASAFDRGEYFVHCSRDGANWSSYMVWISSGKVMGPNKPANDLTD